MGYPVGKIQCDRCLKVVIEWDCGTPGHKCWREWNGKLDKWGRKVFDGHVCAS